MPTTGTAPISIAQINQQYFVGEAFLETIQKAINFVRNNENAGTVIIPQGYTGTDTIAAVFGGSNTIFIVDERQGQRQAYGWDGTHYVAVTINMLGALNVQGAITSPAANIAAIASTTIFADTLVADEATFDQCIVENSPVRTFANTPDGPGEGMVWPPEGVGFSAGDHWAKTLATDVPEFEDPGMSFGWANGRGKFYAQPGSYSGTDPAGFDFYSATDEGVLTSIANFDADGSVIFTPLHVSSDLEAGGDVHVFGALLATGLATFESPIFISHNSTGVAYGAGRNWGTALDWNIPFGMAYTNFINYNANAPGGFSWYSVPPNTDVSDSTNPWMTLNGLGLFVKNLTLDSGDSWPGITLINEAAGVNNRRWAIEAFTNILRFRTMTDDTTADQVILSFNRTGLNVFTNTPFPFSVGNMSLYWTGNGPQPSGGPLIRGGGGSGTGNDITLSPGTTVDNINFGLDSIQGANLDGEYRFWSGGQGNIISTTINRYGSIATNGFVRAGGAQIIGPNIGPPQVQIGVASDGGSPIITLSHQVGAAFIARWSTSLVFAPNGNTISVQMDQGGFTTIYGDLNVSGAKNFRIPHPCKPDKLLFHSAIEGPECAVFYRGEGETVDGVAVIELPDYFEALVKPGQRTVQLTERFDDDDDPVLGSHLATGRVKDGKFTVRSSVPSAKFYWEVKAVRGDIPALEVETDKPEDNDGSVILTPLNDDGDKPEMKKNGKSTKLKRVG